MVKRLPDSEFKQYLFTRTVKNANGCWVWQGCKIHTGYGRVQRRPNAWLAHRLAWTLTHGDIPPETFVLHHCDNPPCINPAHLYLGTQHDNMRDMIARERYNNKGERNGRAKLTANLVRYIRTSSKTGAELGRELGVSRVIISSIRLRKSWQHIPLITPLD